MENINLSYETYSYGDTDIDFTIDKIIIRMPNDKNIIQFSRIDSSAHAFYRKLMENDYMFYYYANKQSFFIKWKLIQTIWKRTDLIKYGELFYTIQKVPDNKVNTLAPLHLLVMFSSMPDGNNYMSPNIANRCFTQNYPSIQKHIIKNTLIMRIMDVNMNTGSMYLNTPNYPEFEEDVQGAINFIMGQYEIDKKNVVFYGGSKGGTGATYHSFLGNYKACIVDPIITLEEHNNKNDLMYLKDVRPLSIEKDINTLNINQEPKYIIGSAQVPFTFKQFQSFKKDRITILDIRDNHIHTHPDISANSTVEQIYYINKLFMEE